MEMDMLREQISNAIKESMKSKNVERLATVRMILAGIKEKDVDARGKGKTEAPEAELMSMMQTMIKQRQESAKIYKEGKREDLALKEESEIIIIQDFLPKQMSDAEVENAIKLSMKEIGATSMKDMGAVMADLRDKYAGQMDFGAASGKIKALLG